MKTSPGPKAAPVIVLVLLYLLLVAAGSSWALRLELATSVVPAGSDAGLMSPSGLWFDRLRDNLLIADTENNRILLVNQQGDVIKTLGRKGELYLPISVAVNLRGTLFVAERNKSVLKVLPAYDGLTQDEYQLLDLSSYAGSRQVQPVALFVDEDGALYVCDRGNRQLLVFNSDRSLRMAIPKVGKPADVWVQGGKIYIADPAFGGVRVYNQDGYRERTLGDSANNFSIPLRSRAIAVDRRNRIWVLEESGAIRAIDLLGNPLLNRKLVGLFSPIDLALDNNNNLYVLEHGGNKVTVFLISEF